MDQIRLLLIPLGIIAFNVIFMLIMREILFASTHAFAHWVALVISSAILGGAAYLARGGGDVETVREEPGSHH